MSCSESHLVRLRDDISFPIPLVPEAPATELIPDAACASFKSVCSQPVHCMRSIEQLYLKLHNKIPLKVVPVKVLKVAIWYSVCSPCSNVPPPSSMPPIPPVPSPLSLPFATPSGTRDMRTYGGGVLGSPRCPKCRNPDTARRKYATGL